MIISVDHPPVSDLPSEEDVDDLTNEIEIMQNFLMETNRLERQNRRLTFQQNAQGRVLTLNYDKKKATEMLRQNVDQIETILSRRRSPESPIDTPFALENLMFTLGQWLDVKDTIGQWLEAQVTKIMPDKICVHFNGWGTRWDEWIEKNSPRIAPFRTYTIQSPQNQFLSPYPSIEPDPEDHEIPEIPTSYENLLLKYMSCFEDVRKMMIQYLKTNMKLAMQKKVVDMCQLAKNQIDSKEESKISPTKALSELTSTKVGTIEEEKTKRDSLDRKMRLLSGQLAPILDRMGRMMADMGPHFSVLANSGESSSNEPIQFTRFPAATAEQESDRPTMEVAPRSEPLVPIMPGPADISSLIELTEERDRQTAFTPRRVIITVANNPSLNNHNQNEEGIQANSANEETHS